MQRLKPRLRFVAGAKTTKQKLQISAWKPEHQQAAAAVFCRNSLWS
jgi:hypothetical protein